MQDQSPDLLSGKAVADSIATLAANVLDEGSEPMIEAPIHVNVYDEDNALKDASKMPPEHFKPYMSSFRFKCREYFLQFTNGDSEAIHRWQQRFRTPWRDEYFAYTALLGSHMFYVLGLPMPTWVGHYAVTKDLVYILGYSIYITGFFKDYLCLPRPLSPPCHRIALSKYTTKEYGAPSSHSANAMGATLLMLSYLWEVRNNYSQIFCISCAVAIIFYYLTLAVGRIYCGMHGILDISLGSLVGLFCFTWRLLSRECLQYDLVISNCGWWFPITVPIVGLILLFTHVKPVDNCPCFEDTVCFIGVITGIDLSTWLSARLYPIPSPLDIIPTAQTSVIRILLGSVITILWKGALSKPIVYTLLKLVMTDDRTRSNSGSPIENSTQTLYKGTPRILIVGRFIIYASIPIVVVLVCPTLFQYVGC
ncbi:HBR228Cp [Eremothecium sinecaudum]|uniref:HBR228Cp n=1 Tax=Eremothecium sinecaudum TaxID=45286 RepID=A0A120K184_9SACH|nr:HBR228Cp [Eremothecium sinecaudum]AMD19129.1 HBR228Cp [Eremothecium sinecaudum]